MPATAGRVRMPANNRVHSSAALQTHGIWQSAIGYDPYAPNKDDKDKSSQKSLVPEPEGENAYASFQGLLALARITGSNADEVRGACKKCGRVGHLTFQCRNFLSAKDEGDREGKDPAIQNTVLTGLEKLKGERVKGREKRVVESEESSDESEESETSDSGYDSEIERAIAEKYGKRFSGERSKASKNSKKDANESDEDRDGRKRGRSKKRSGKSRRSDSADEEEVRRKKRKEKRRRREEEEERRQRRRMRKSGKEKRSNELSDDDISDDNAKHRHKRRRRGYSVSDSDDNDSDDSRVGRAKKRPGKKSRNHHRDEE
ncbi:CAX-interacting protein 4-like [Primulina eburnea]|uniref:CAX-interacting protein 4-like n=1 Tax=Primulina eburnea TaxID=1245227 RepID=UPI003C6C48AF